MIEEDKAYKKRLLLDSFMKLEMALHIAISEIENGPKSCGSFISIESDIRQASAFLKRAMEISE